MTRPAIVWLRRDLRLADQAAFAAAAKAGPVIPVFVLDDVTPKHRKMGGASRWWLHHSLASLAKTLEGMGSKLILRRGTAADVIAELARETGARAVHALHHYEPWWRNAERALKDTLPDGCTFERHHGNYLMPPGSITTGSGQPYKIYTPFWRALALHMPPPAPLPARASLAAPENWPESDALGDWHLLPVQPNWAEGFASEWQPGEAGAARRIADFADCVRSYQEDRNLPSIEGTSRLSPHLHFGEVSPATVWHAQMDAGGSVETFLKELVWRDYGQNVIAQYPDYGRTNARDGFDAFPWRDADDPAVAAEIRLWQQGRTGYPIVDAGMRQLWVSGWMHNRVRMIAASFLIKHLLVDWRVGEAWFWDTLVDADYGSNATNWQWTAGTGIDSNMFVRIMAPLSQSEKFDASAYIRQWVPELANVPDDAIHDPHAAGVFVKGYPKKIIGHKQARERALAAIASIRSA
ncbi:deoxyribodipyrimidine photo-lyase [Blastomonas sp.]|uniref:cryptochrome/photolyase family protein n=1 Tax=Blastomonas sp. TaxID=1909299 RepID=UPI0035939E17